MNRRKGCPSARSIGLALTFVGLACVSPGWAQTLPETEAPDAPPVGSSREAELEQRILQLENLVRTLSTKVESMSEVPPPIPDGSLPAQGDEVGGVPGEAAGSPSAPRPPNVDNDGVGGGSPATSGAPAGGGTGSNAGEGEEVQGPATISSAAPPPSSRFNMPAPVPDFPLKVRFGPGFEMRTDDDEYSLQFHNLTQVDLRLFEEPNQLTTRDTFVIPRQWFIFSGRLTKPYEYYVAIAEGFDTLNILDVFLNVHYDDRLQFRFGRYKTPFTYEFYALPIQGLITPERSLFFNNFGLNRDLGGMFWGQLFDKRLDYAAGLFNGTRNGFIDANDAKDVAAFINARPFGKAEGSPLENLNFGGSVEAGRQQNAPIPQVFRTNVPTTGNQAVGIPFLALNRDVTESGERAFWSVHAAWYYRHLSLIAEWQSGFQDYAKGTNLATKIQLPVQSYYVQAGYFLTGEMVASRNTVLPLRPFDLRKGKRGPGAIELTGRYNALTLGDEVFTRGLADPNLWSNRIDTFDLGVNWYWNTYLKWSFLWEHALFGDPVLSNPGKLSLTNDMFLLRAQVWF